MESSLELWKSWTLGRHRILMNANYDLCTKHWSALIFSSIPEMKYYTEERGDSMSWSKRLFLPKRNLGVVFGNESITCWSKANISCQVMSSDGQCSTERLAFNRVMDYIYWLSIPVTSLMCGYSSNARPSNSQCLPPPLKSVPAKATYFVLKVNEPHFQVVLSHNPAGWVTSVNPPCQHAPLHDWVPREIVRHALWQLHQHYQVCWKGKEQKFDKLFRILQNRGKRYGRGKESTYLRSATVIVSVELAQGQRASGFRPLPSNAFRKASQADKDPGMWNTGKKLDTGLMCSQ